VGYELIVVGASLGGFRALEALLAGLPSHFPLPVAVVQHRSSDSDGSLVTLLSRHSLLAVLEVEDKQPIEPGRVYVGPADYHLLVEEGHFALSTEAPVRFARPSIDVFFESTADAYLDRAIAILLTGSNIDGAQGMRKIKECGGLTIVQEPATAESRRMPEAALALAKVDKVLPVEEIAPFLLNHVL
jgi:two-component system chemotaxis response regulator CheB